MPNIDQQAKAWQKQNAARIGLGIAQLREASGLSAVQLSNRCGELGFPISRVAISKIENGSREGKLDLAEIVILARALSVPPIRLIYPGMPDERVTPAPNEPEIRSAAAAEWFWGQPATWEIDYAQPVLWSKPKTRGIHEIAWVREHEKLRRGLIEIERRLRVSDSPAEKERLMTDYSKVAADLDKVRDILRSTFHASIAADLDLTEVEFDG